MKRLCRWLRWCLKVLFGFRAYQTEVLKAPGPLLLVPNHVSWFDWLFIFVWLEGADWKVVTSRATAQISWLHRWIMINRYTFPIDAQSPYAVKRMAEFLSQGGRLVLFAEGRISRTGTLMKLFEGTGFLLYKTGARVIPCYIRGADRLPFSPNANRKQCFPRVSVHFGQPRTAPKQKEMSVMRARGRLTDWLRREMVEQQFWVELENGPTNVLAAVHHAARGRWGLPLMEDMKRKPLTYRRLLLGSHLLTLRWRGLIAAEEERVGVLLPNVNATPVVLLSLWQAGKVPAVLNFSVGMGAMVSCARLAGLKRLISSREFIERAGLDLEPLRELGIEIIWLEEVRKTIPGGEKALAWLRYHVAPPSPEAFRPPDSAVVLFTSGSEGTPKGVELTHRNLMANIHQMLAVTDLQDSDRIFNCLPMFHSFGLTVGTFVGLVRGLYVFLYPSPLHYRVVPSAFYDRDCTVFLSTNTFLNGYARKAHPYDFRSLRYLFAAAEKLAETTAQRWSREFGVRILEGYGATECGPCVSVNTLVDCRFGSVGRTLPGIRCRLEPVEGVEEGGRLLVAGPNIMKGYLNPEANAEFKALSGWYDTGDVAEFDEDDFLHIRGRLKRFAKVSGEMVSLTAVEEALAGAFSKYGQRFQIAVVAVPDEEKGEKLVAVSNESKLTLQEVRSVIQKRGLSNLYAPRQLEVMRDIPMLGSGKVDHRALRRQLSEE